MLAGLADLAADLAVGSADSAGFAAAEAAVAGLESAHWGSPFAIAVAFAEGCLAGPVGQTGFDCFAANSLAASPTAVACAVDAAPAPAVFVVVAWPFAAPDVAVVGPPGSGLAYSVGPAVAAANVPFAGESAARRACSSCRFVVVARAFAAVASASSAAVALAQGLLEL